MNTLPYTFIETSLFMILKFVSASFDLFLLLRTETTYKDLIKRWDFFKLPFSLHNSHSFT